MTCKGSWAWVALFLKAFVRSPRLSALWNGVGGVLRWSHTLTPPYPHLGVIVIFSFFFNFPLHFSPQHLPLYFRKLVTSDLWPNNILYLVNKKKNCKSVDTLIISLLNVSYAIFKTNFGRISTANSTVTVTKNLTVNEKWLIKIKQNVLK